MKLIAVIFISVTIVPSFSLAQSQNQGTKIVYGSSPWNIDSTKIDSAFLFMRDKSSGKVVKILLEESEPDSSIFEGHFQLQMKGGQAIDPEVYIPPKDMRDTDKAISRFYQLLEQKRITGKPLIIKKDETGSTVYDVYDTKEQAHRAQVAYLDEQKARSEMSKPAPKPIASEKVLESVNIEKSGASAQAQEAAAIADQKALLDKLAFDAAQREAERVRLEQIERQKAEERQRKTKELGARQRAEQKRIAEEYAQKALQHYQAGEFPLAEENFAKSVELDPENKQHYFRYGVSLYRNNKFNEALVVLKLTKDDPETSLEKKYYMGLIHMRLKELDPALGLMREVAAAKQPVMSPSASFYEGVILFTQEQYESAKASFETVLDTSKDPRLDEQAEEYIERITLMAQQARIRGKKFLFSGTTGVMYDSNVLLESETNVTSQGDATDSADFRLLVAGDGEYRPVSTQSKDFGVKGTLYYLYSFKDEVSLADPFLINVSAPYTHKGTAMGRGYKLSIKPAYEIVHMDANDDGTRENILNSIILFADNTFVMRPTWFASYIVELRQDDSRTETTTAADNADAMKSTLKTTQTFIINKARKEIVSGTLGYTVNDAKGDAKYYSRIDLGTTYFRPFQWGKEKATWLAGLSVYTLDYSKATPKRKDVNTTFTTGFSKPVKDWMSWGVIATYSSNASNSTTNDYSKYTVMTTATFNYGM